MLKEKDFIEVHYTGRIKETDQIFDTTDEAVAKKENVFNSQFIYGPRIICLGQKQLIPFIDNYLLGKEINKEYTIEISPKDAFGNKDQSLIKVMNTNDLRQQKINPFPGLQLNLSGIMGTVRSVNGGRTAIDFNHPLAGRNLIYKIRVNKIIDNKKVKLESLLGSFLGLTNKDYELKLEENKAEVVLKRKLSDKIKEEFKTKVKELIQDIELSI